MAKKINWYKYLTDKIVGKETALSYNDAETAAKDWTLCACGSQEKILRSPAHNNEPWDGDLNNLGCQFYDQISSENYPEALVVLLRIQERATVLLRALRRYSPSTAKALRQGGSVWDDDGKISEKIDKFYRSVGGSHAHA